MISTVILLTLLLSHVGVVLSQACTSAVQGLGGVPVQNQLIYLDPTLTCTFAEAIMVQGACPTYTDSAEIVSSGGFAATTVAVPANQFVTIQYPIPTPAGQMPEGIYALTDIFLNQGFGAVVTITHNPMFVETASTSTIVTGTTIFTTITQTTTVTSTSTSTPPAQDVVRTATVTFTAAAPRVLATTTLTPTVTKTMYSTTKVTVTPSCLAFNYPPQQSKMGARAPGGNHHKRSYPLLPRAIEPQQISNNVLEKRGDNPCNPFTYGGQPTATLYTTTILSTTTYSITSTLTEVDAVTITTATTLATASITEFAVAVTTVTPPAVTKFVKTKHARAVTQTVTSTITVTVNAKGHKVTAC